MRGDYTSLELEMAKSSYTLSCQAVRVPHGLVKGCQGQSSHKKRFLLRALSFNYLLIAIADSKDY